MGRPKFTDYSSNSLIACLQHLALDLFAHLLFIAPMSHVRVLFHQATAE